MRDLRVNQSLFQELARKAESANVYSIQQIRLAPTTWTYSGDVRPVCDVLLNVARSAGIPVRFDTPVPPGTPASVSGWTVTDGVRPTEINLITKGQPLTSQARTLLHELAHAFTPNIARAQEKDRGDAEIIAEAAAYIVGDQLGFDGLNYSANYVADWSRHNTWDRSPHPERVRALAPYILETAALLGRAVERAYSAGRTYREAA